MSRLPLPTLGDMSDAQRLVYDRTAAGRRGRVPAPIRAWLWGPELADRAERLGELIRFETSLPARLSELAILVVAHYWNARYEWAVHAAEAVRAGLDPALVDRIAAGYEPAFEREDERILFAFCTALVHARRVPTPVYDAAMGTFGERAIVELVGILGYYTLISMTLNAFEIAPEAAMPPGNSEGLPEPGGSTV